MNKSESKYFNTALLMNQALIELLNKKDFEFITIKEICAKAGVNRSTFYLHYENINELLAECINNIDKKFMTFFDEKTKDIFKNINECTTEQLILISPQYLTPYLTYIKENKIVYQVTVKHQAVMSSDERFSSLNRHIFNPIFKRFGIDENTQNYMITYYINGISAIIIQWIKHGCVDDIKYIENIIINCIFPKNCTQ